MRWIAGWAVAIILLSSVPYVFGILITPPEHRFVGFTHNIDDAAVYLSWIRQVADGEVFIRNLFTNDPHPGRSFNVLFLLMGWTASASGLSPAVVFHIFRVLLGLIFFLVVYRFVTLFGSRIEHIRAVSLLLGLSSGIGWMVPGAKPPTGPVDVWQPEAITFLSVYLNPLFLAGLILLLGAFERLERVHRDGRLLDAVLAGLFLLLLGNVHTYDVVTVACVWAAYLLVIAVAERKLPVRTFLLTLLAATIAVPSAGYQAYLLATDPVFRARAATPTPSPALWAFAAGYGLVLAGALAGAMLHCRAARRHTAARDRYVLKSPTLLYVWSVVGFVVPYIPVAQQRKLVMGLHIPLCILCAFAITVLLDRIAVPRRRAILAAFVAITAVSNLKFLAEDMRLLTQSTTAPGFSPFISRAEARTMSFLRKNATESDSVLAPPGFALFVPAFAGRAVFYGHWSETPDYGGRLRKWLMTENPSVPVAERERALIETGATLIVRYLENEEWDPPTPDLLCTVFETRAPTGSRIVVYRVLKASDRTVDRE